MKQFKLITFDVTGTLLSFRRSIGEIYSDAANYFGIAADPQVIEVRSHKYLSEMNQQHPNFGLYSGLGWKNWWRVVVSKTFEYSENNDEHHGNVDQLSDFLIESFSTKKEWKLVEGSVDLLEYLKKSSVDIGVLSNYDPRLHKVLEDIGILKYFIFVVTSYEAGFSKPDVGIFQVAEKKYIDLGKTFDRRTTVHIGDSFKHDYCGAINAGWNAVLIDPSIVKNGPESNAIFFNSLLEFQENLLKSCQ